MRILPVHTKLILIGLLVTSSGCATSSERFDRMLSTTGFERNTVPGDPFEHLILTKNTDGVINADLHIYIEGDGSPWIAGRWVAADPTPRKPVMLELMQLDPGPVLYLGRPCYFGLQQNCKPENWSSGRYSKIVLNSMLAALNNALKPLKLNGDIVVIGHSGGGVVAMLLAPRIPKASMLVTLAANLDIDRWTQYHGYSPLLTSLNPATEAPLNTQIAQLHLVGESDSNVPIQLMQPVVDKQANAHLLRYQGYDHNCCWAEIWPNILDRLQRWELDSLFLNLDVFAYSQTN
jgi:pimeloyl-ACP methyl ester carboxylesterase